MSCLQEKKECLSVMSVGSWLATLKRRWQNLGGGKAKQNSHWPPSPHSSFLIIVLFFFFRYEFCGKQNLLSTSIHFFFPFGGTVWKEPVYIVIIFSWHWTHICNTCSCSSGKRLTFAVVGGLSVYIYISDPDVKSEVKLLGFCKNLLPILIWTVFFLKWSTDI